MSVQRWKLRKFYVRLTVTEDTDGKKGTNGGKGTNGKKSTNDKEGMNI